MAIYTKIFTSQNFLLYNNCQYSWALWTEPDCNISLWEQAWVRNGPHIYTCYILLQLHRIILYTYTIKAVYTGTQCIRARCLTLSLSLFTSVILATFTWPTLWYFETSRILSLAYLVMVLEYTKQPEILAVFKFGSLDPNQLYKKIGSL